MAIGTTGFTAFCVMALQLGTHDLQPGDGGVLVTGAAGGVWLGRGMRARRYTAWPRSAGLGGADYLRQLGAARIVDRAEFSSPGKPLQAGAGPGWSAASARCAGQCLHW
jgi:acrylyl-CoA reductase (NADPH)